MDLLILILQGVIVAATPLVFAAVGELVTERSGVLNLGIDKPFFSPLAIAFGNRHGSRG